MKNIQRGSNANLPGRQTGVTLLELLIVVAIVAIISAIAYPSYTQFVVKTKRTAATAVLLQVGRISDPTSGPRWSGGSWPRYRSTLVGAYSFSPRTSGFP